MICSYMCHGKRHGQNGMDMDGSTMNVTMAQSAMANLRYPAKKKKKLSWLVDNPIDTKRLKDYFLPI